ncbi:hypothetical protein Pth03_79990 [Planotetraspora thailandica]|uniref:Uncharacterized protein n=1 Tax=Planotetraspora thailandica TaxID=487172 RepID=A0A8J4DG02_9ACTN|nr:hypothetical protein [Planotetraspora thailandica]GII59610.1 hypothetical protein Pth03_79990 [Planotetraspora thailandica]
MAVIHQERVAWEGARVFVSAADADAYWWLSETIEQRLGAAYRARLTATRTQLQQQDQARNLAEIGAWRVFLEDLLHTRPDIQPVVVELIAETSGRLGRR